MVEIMELESNPLEIVQGLCGGGRRHDSSHQRTSPWRWRSGLCRSYGIQRSRVRLSRSSDTSVGPLNTTDFDATSALK